LWCRKAIAAALLVVVGCGGQATTPATDATTAKFALVEAGLLCDVRAANAPTEAALQAILDRRLQAAGLDQAGWRRWHDLLAASPARAAQLADATKRPCA